MELNTLSWMIYFAEVLGGLSSLFGFVFLMLCIGVIAGAIIWAVKTFNGYDEDDAQQATRASNIMKQLILFAAGVAFVDLLIPSSRTVYLVAASEMGEQVINTETATKLKKIIDYNLDKIIAEQEEQ